MAVDLSAMQEWIEKTQRMEVPLVEINGDLIAGFDWEKLREKLGLSVLPDFWLIPGAFTASSSNRPTEWST